MNPKDKDKYWLKISEDESIHVEPPSDKDKDEPDGDLKKVAESEHLKDHNGIYYSDKNAEVIEQEESI